MRRNMPYELSGSICNRFLTRGMSDKGICYSNFEVPVFATEDTGKSRYLIKDGGPIF